MKNLDRYIGRAFIGEGLATVAVGFAGGAGVATFAVNIGVVAVARIYLTRCAASPVLPPKGTSFGAQGGEGWPKAYSFGDHPMMLMALNMAVERALPHCTVAHALCASQAKEYFLQDSVLIDLILLDINLPDMDGRQQLKHIKEAERTSEIPVIIFTSADSRDVAIECNELGASRFVDKKSDPEYLIFSIRSALAEKHHRSAWTVDDVPPGSPLTLSRRQRELAALIIAGYSNKEIAKTMGISSSTVKNHLTKMMSCMNVGSRGKLAAKLQAKTFGMLDGDAPQCGEAGSAHMAKQ
jgi:DNA-binding NarL/FixJ family response regulator